MRTLLLIFAAIAGFGSCKTEIYAGPHFNYTRLYFNNPSHLQGYLGGVTTGIEQRWNHFFYAVDFEGSWNAGPFTGDPCQKSDLIEYFLELKLAGVFYDCNMRIEPYLGFGWDQFENRQDPDTANLRYLYTKLFIPVGFFVRWDYCNWDWAMQLEFRPDVYDRLKVVGVHLKPDWGYAVRAQFPFKKFYPICNGCITFAVVPFFDWNEFGQVIITNSAGASLVIPRLIRWDLGVRLLAGYQF